MTRQKKSTPKARCDIERPLTAGHSKRHYSTIVQEKLRAGQRHGLEAVLRSLGVRNPQMGVRIRGTLGDVDPFNKVLREPQVGFRRIPLKGSPS